MKTNAISSKNKIKVIITDDQKAFRQAMRLYLEDQKLKVVGEAANGKELIQLLANPNLVADVIILDLEMPIMDGAQALIEIRKLYPKQKVIMLTYINNDDVIAEMKKYGANAYLDKNKDLDDIINVIRELHTSEDFNYDTEEINPKYTLAEKEIIPKIVQGMTNTELAKDRGRSIKSIEAHRKNIYDKANCKNLAEFVNFCKKEGLEYLGKSKSAVKS